MRFRNFLNCDCDAWKSLYPLWIKNPVNNVLFNYCPWCGRELTEHKSSTDRVIDDLMRKVAVLQVEVSRLIEQSTESSHSYVYTEYK